MQFIKGMYGLGDNIFQRAFVREIGEDVYLQTTWPQLYRDLPRIFPVAGRTKLRTQSKNVAAQGAIWHKEPVIVNRRIQYHAGPFSLTNTSVLRAMEHCFRVKARVFDLPAFDKPPIDGPYAIVRPVTVRSEWSNPARNPCASYISEAARILSLRGIKTVSVADLEEGAERAEELPETDLAYNRGELTLERLMGAVQGAALVVGGVGWIVPAAIAAAVPLIVILGGQGGHNAPSKITGAPMDVSKARWIWPDNYCRCTSMQHGCDKNITDFGAKFEKEVEELCSTTSLTIA